MGTKSHHPSWYRPYIGEWSYVYLNNWMPDNFWFKPSLDEYEIFWCNRCRGYYLNADMTFIEDIPQERNKCFCPKCAILQHDSYKETCQNCGKEYLKIYHAGRYCDECYPVMTAPAKVRGANSRAKKRGEPATLTVDQWMDTLKHFDYRCAYCGGVFQLIEHFVSIGKGVGTTHGNCVPGCYPCNGLKLQSELYMPNFETVRAYLWQRQLDATT